MTAPVQKSIHLQKYKHYLANTNFSLPQLLKYYYTHKNFVTPVIKFLQIIHFFSTPNLMEIKQYFVVNSWIFVANNWISKIKDP